MTNHPATTKKAHQWDGLKSAAPGGKSAPNGMESLPSEIARKIFTNQPNGRLNAHSARQSRHEDSATDQPMIDRQAYLVNEGVRDLVERFGLRQFEFSGAERLDELYAIKRRDFDGDVPQGRTLADLYVDGAPATHEVDGRHGLSGFREWPSNHDSTNEILRVTARAWEI